MLAACRVAATSLRLSRGSLVQTGAPWRVGQRAGIISAGDETDSHDDFKPQVKGDKATQTVQDHIEQTVSGRPLQQRRTQRMVLSNSNLLVKMETTFSEEDGWEYSWTDLLAFGHPYQHAQDWRIGETIGGD